ncbi:MAG TPA: DMT family transporter [Thermodesulfobacteriota bacterium]
MRVRALARALLAAALFGAATPASKWLLSDLTPFQLAGLLYLGAALGVCSGAVRGGRVPLPAGGDRNRARLLGAVVAGGLVGPVLLLVGLRLAEAASVSLWLSFELTATALLGALVFRDHLGRAGWAGVAMALAASCLLSAEGGAAGPTAGTLVLLACLCWGLDNHLTALIDGVTPSQSTFWKALVAGTVNLGIGVALDPFTARPPLVLAGLLVGAWSYGASIVLYITAAQGLGATRAQIAFATAPLFGVLLSVTWLGESLAPVHAAAAALFLASVALVTADRHAHAHEHEALEHEHGHRHDDGHHTHEHPGLRPSAWHTHRHRHEPVVHSHPHWPDLHHRHRHDADP